MMDGWIEDRERAFVEADRKYKAKMFRFRWMHMLQIGSIPFSADLGGLVVYCLV